MLFNSISYAIFLPIVFILYWCLPQKYRWILLFVASYYFYMSWDIKYVVLILFTTVVSYTAARLIERANEKNAADKLTQKTIITGAAILCLGVLFFFKYFNFLSQSFSDALGAFSIEIDPFLLDILLPVGISFYTFQTLSYVVDVYRGKIKAEHHFGYYATFISFFPQLVAGPIERTENLLPQIKAEHTFNYDQATYGLKLLVWGFFKKIVIADRLASYVRVVYDSPRNFQGFPLVLATIFFTVQIYCDFSGYSDIAIGSAKLFGIDLMENFRSPYFAQSIKEFWSRWHISLSTWFKDYVYIPLGGNRVSKPRRVWNLIVTFLVSGLWHGANWTFVIWGGIHGVAQAIENLVIPKNKQKSNGIVRLLRIIFVFLFAAFTWIFFVSDSLSDAFYVITHLFDGITAPVTYLRNGFANLEMRLPDFLSLVILGAILTAYDYLSLKRDVILAVTRQKRLVRWFIYVAMVLIVIFFSQKGVAAEFVYFQF